MSKLQVRVELGSSVRAEPGHADAGQWLADQGWTVHAVDSREEMARLGRPAPVELAATSYPAESS